jgi:hypothetical protein
VTTKTVGTGKYVFQVPNGDEPNDPVPHYIALATQANTYLRSIYNASGAILLARGQTTVVFKDGRGDIPTGTLNTAAIVNARSSSAATDLVQVHYTLTLFGVLVCHAVDKLGKPFSGTLTCDWVAWKDTI